MIHAGVRTCLVMLRVILPGDGDVMTSGEISNVCQIQFYLHPTSTAATHSAAHFPMKRSYCHPPTIQHLWPFIQFPKLHVICAIPIFCHCCLGLFFYVCKQSIFKYAICPLTLVETYTHLYVLVKVGWFVRE